MAAYSSNSYEPSFEDPSARSPRSMRHSNLQRHVSRPFDGYGANVGGRFGTDNGSSSLRYENLSVRDAFNQAPPINNTNFPYDMGAAQTWNSGPPTMPAFGNGINGVQSYGPVRGMKQARPRADMGFYDQQSNSQPFSPLDSSSLSSVRPSRDLSGDGDDELIPTAIVIKNIPFAVKKEQLQSLMTEMNLPLPYAFNYHFDNGVFRGLAFANFTSADETGMVIRMLNHFELNGRKLRVEYKKMLPLFERERIEREKRERRGQLEEQHRPMQPGQLQSQMSFASLASSLPRNTPSPASQGPAKPDIDMNDPQNIEFYSKILLFKNDPSREVLIFPPTLNPTDRRTVHTLAHKLGLHHNSRGTGEQRQVHIFRNPPGSNTSPPNPSVPDAFQGNDTYRRNLSRAATTDFAEARAFEPYNQLRGQSSVGMLEVDSNLGSYRHNATLRSAKSFHDLQYRGASPVSSTSSFPVGLQANGARLQALHDTDGSSTPNLTPTTATNGHGLPNDENFLINGVSTMNIGSNQGQQASPQRRGRFFSNWDETPSYQTAPIGSNRAVSNNADNASQERTSIRQPRGPGADRSNGFRRQNGRGSDELRNASSVIAE